MLDTGSDMQLARPPNGVPHIAANVVIAFNWPWTLETIGESSWMTQLTDWTLSAEHILEKQYKTQR
jgi:hypothetical protein